MTATLVTLSNNFDKARRAVTGDELLKAAMAGGHVIEAYAKINAKDVFSSKATNTLANSIIVEEEKSDLTSATVNIGPTVIYGRIQELGGVIKPVLAKSLHFVIDGVEIFAKLVHIPARPYLRPAVDEHMPEIEQAVGFELKKRIEGACD